MGAPLQEWSVVAELLFFVGGRSDGLAEVLSRRPCQAIHAR